MSTPPETRYTTDDLTEETLDAHPALRAWVSDVECWHGAPTPNEAMLVNVIVRQQSAIAALVEQWVFATPSDAEPSAAVQIAAFDREDAVRP